MDSKELRRVQDGLIDAAKEIAALPLEELSRQLEKADNIGPFVDPTWWRAKSPDLGRLRKILEPALALKRAMVGVRDGVMEELAKDPKLMMEALKKEGARLERRRAQHEAQEAGR